MASIQAWFQYVNSSPNRFLNCKAVFLIITLLPYLNRKDIMPRFTKHLVLLLLILVVINAAPQRRQTNAQSLDQRMGEILLETRQPERRQINQRSLEWRMGDTLPETRAPQNLFWNFQRGVEKMWDDFFG